MSIDIAAAEQFILANARTLERHRLAVVMHGAAPDQVLRALRAYQNVDGGVGHALEPDIRDSESQPTAALHALDVLSTVGRLDDPMVEEIADWVARSALPDGSVPIVTASHGTPPRAPFMKDARPDVGSFLTFAIAGHLHDARHRSTWLDRATDWCWEQIDGRYGEGGYWVKFALGFLDRVPDPRRAEEAVQGLRSHLRPDGSVPVPGGIEGEQVTPLDLSSRPGRRSRALFTDAQIDADLDRIAAGQLDDGGWDFEFLHWSPGQSVEWRGLSTVMALDTLAAHGRIDLDTPAGAPVSA